MTFGLILHRPHAITTPHHPRSSGVVSGIKIMTGYSLCSFMLTICQSTESSTIWVERFESEAVILQASREDRCEDAVA